MCNRLHLFIPLTRKNMMNLMLNNIHASNI
jgi:hypothetical protein